jgi:Domain of unknown function (DUF4920)
MTKKLYILLFAAGLGLTACTSSVTTPSGAEHAAEATETTTSEFLGKEPMDSMSFAQPVNFGPKKVTADGAMAATELPSKLASVDSLTNQKISGTIKSCCQNKGCWLTMELANGNEMRVRFRDYAFFVPKNSAGNKVVLEGTAYREMISVDDQRHYAKDGGASEAELAKITAPKEEFTFMADGALVMAQ